MKVLLSVLLLLASTFCFGQDDNQKVRIVTNDGTVLVGSIVLSDADKVTIKTEYGENVVNRADIESLDYGTSESDSEDWGDGYMDRYSGSHYLFGQSAFGLEKGQAYYENTYLFLNAFTYGVTDNFSIGGGFETASIFFEGHFPVTYFTPKLSFPFKKGAFSIGSTVAIVPYDGAFAVGLLSGALTLGSLRDNFTVGVGVGYTFEDGIADGFYPISISGMTRVSEKVSLITENIIAIGDFNTEAVITAGVRIHGRTSGNFLTISLIRPTEETDFLVYPFFSGTVRMK